MSGGTPVGATEPILELRGIHKAFKGTRSVTEVIRRAPAPRLLALDGVSLSVQPKRTLALVGESGSGKSTVAKAVVRLVEPDSGTMSFDGEDVLGAGREELRQLRRRVQLIYQDPASSLNPRLSVGDAIMEAAKVHGQIGSEGKQARLDELLEQVGLPKQLAKRRPRALSGGQQQRVAIARALATRPEMIIADEVTSALDVAVQGQIVNLLTEMQREFGLAMMFISHDLPLVGHIADDVAVMYLGRIVESGPVAEVFGNPTHPYTVALLGAQPSRERRGRKMAPIRGEIPSAFEIPSGCRFRTRCPHAMEICKQVDPPRVAVSDGHGSWCHLLAPDGRQAEDPRPAVAKVGANQRDDG